MVLRSSEARQTSTSKAGRNSLFKPARSWRRARYRASVVIQETHCGVRSMGVCTARLDQKASSLFGGLGESASYSSSVQCFDRSQSPIHEPRAFPSYA